MAVSGSREPHQNITSVGGLVVRDGALLVVRMSYGPTQGRYMLPGGLVDPDETLDLAIAREVREETGVEARPAGIVGLRSRVTERGIDTYVIWLLEHLAGEPRPDGRENDDARYLPLAGISERDDVAYLAQYLAARILAGDLRPHRLVTDYAYQLPGTTSDDWKLFL